MKRATIVFAQSGTGRCIYTELVDLQAIGRLEMQRATTIEFNNDNQCWQVRTMKGNALFESRSRNECHQWEQENLTPANQLKGEL